MIVFIVAYMLVLCIYFYTETSGEMRLRAPNKILLATMFLVYGIIQFATRYSQTSFHLIVMAGLFLAWLGDVFLLFDFGRGGDFFLGANVCFIAYQLTVNVEQGHGFGQFWWVFAVTAVIVSAIIFFVTKKKLDMGAIKWPMMMYMASITLSGMCGISLMILCAGTPYALFGLGIALFMVSDYLLSVYKFFAKGNKWVLRCNSLTYFVGMLLVVLSMGI